MAKFFLLLRTRSVLVNEPFNNSRRSPSISQRAHPFAIKTAITATKQPFISAFRTDQRMGRTHPPHTCNHPHGAFTAKVVKNCPQHNSVKHFLLWSADSARCCAGKCGCTVAGALWNPSKIPVVFQTSSDTQDQCLATCLWQSSTAWALWEPNLQLLAPQTAAAPYPEAHFLCIKCPSISTGNQNILKTTCSKTE